MKQTFNNNIDNSFCIICNSRISHLERLTCSEKCHEEFIKFIEHKFGVYKRVIDIETGIIYKVPIREIIENGLKWEDLTKFPMWVD